MPAVEQVRDLDADLAICEAAGRGPWLVDHGVASQVRQPNVSNRRRIVCPPDADGINDSRFIAAAREGWSSAIRRAMEAEAKIDRLENELRMLQGDLNRGRGCWD